MKYISIVLLILYLSICYSSSIFNKTTRPGGGNPHPHTTHAPISTRRTTIRPISRPPSTKIPTTKKSSSSQPTHNTQLYQDHTRTTQSHQFNNRGNKTTPRPNSNNYDSHVKFNNTGNNISNNHDNEGKYHSTSARPNYKTSTYSDHTRVTQPHQNNNKNDRTTPSPNYNGNPEVNHKKYGDSKANHYDTEEIQHSTGFDDHQPHNSMTRRIIDEFLSALENHKDSIEDIVYQKIKQKIEGCVNENGELNRWGENNQELDSSKNVINESFSRKGYDSSTQNKSYTPDINTEGNRSDANLPVVDYSENTIIKLSEDDHD